MKTKNITPETEAAFDVFKQYNRYRIFADSIGELCDAEVRWIHACSNNGDEFAEILASALSRPAPIRTFDFDMEDGLEIFADGSLYEKSNADSTVWAAAGDYYTNWLYEPITAGLREFFGVEAPEDASEYRITMRRNWYGSLTTESFATRDDGSEVAVFTSREDAEQWISDREAGEYRLSHNEASRPEYIVTPCA